MRLCFLLLVLLFQPNVLSPMNPKEIHQRAVVVDLHCDALYQMVTKDYLITEEEGPQSYTPEATLKTLKEGQVDAQTFAIWVPSNRMKDPTEYASEAFSVFQKITRKASDFVQARSETDIYLAKEQNKIAALLSIEGAEAIGENAEDLRPWAKDGLVILGLAWNRKNAFCDAAQSKEKPFNGLSPEGEKLVDLAAELGVLIDISHASDDAFWDVMRRTTRPVVASHSSSRAVFLHPRNLDDEQLRAIRATGGVAGVNFHANFLRGTKPITIDDVADHVMHMLSVAGPEVLALGSDFDGDIVTPKGLETAARFPDLTEVLARRGVSAEDLDLFLGRNFLRALAKVNRESFPKGSIPIPIRGVTATSSSQEEKAPASLVTDHSSLTSWKPKSSDKSPTLSIEKEGKPPSRIAIRGVKPANTPVELTITAGEKSLHYTFEFPEDSEGFVLRLPLLTGSSWKASLSFQKQEDISVAEFVAYE